MAKQKKKRFTIEHPPGSIADYQHSCLRDDIPPSSRHNLLSRGKAMRCRLHPRIVTGGLDQEQRGLSQAVAKLDELLSDESTANMQHVFVVTWEDLRQFGVLRHRSAYVRSFETF